MRVDAVAVSNEAVNSSVQFAALTAEAAGCELLSVASVVAFAEAVVVTADDCGVADVPKSLALVASRAPRPRPVRRRRGSRVTFDLPAVPSVSSPSPSPSPSHT